MKIISKINRIGLRYVNFFKSDILQKIDLKIELDKNKLFNKTILKTEIENNNILSVLQITNDAINSGSQGSAIDIDCVLNNVKEKTIPQILTKNIDDLHNEEKVLFFKIIGEKYLSEFSPEY